MKWNSFENKPKYNEPILMLVEGVALETYKVYIAGYYHTDNVWCESFGSNLEQELGEFKILKWKYIEE